MSATSQTRIQTVRLTAECGNRHAWMFYVIAGMRSNLIPTGSRLFLLWNARRRKVGIPDIGCTLPFAVGLFFPNLNVFAMIIHGLAAGIVDRHLVGSAEKGQVARFRYLHLGRFPTDNKTGGREQILPTFSNRLLRRVRGSIRRHDHGVIGIE